MYFKADSGPIQRPLHTYLPDARTMLQIHRASVPTQESIANLPPGARPGTAALDPASKHLLVRCAHGETIAFGEAKIQDKKLVPAKDFWNGVREGWWERVDGNKVVRLRTQA